MKSNKLKQMEDQPGGRIELDSSDIAAKLADRLAKHFPDNTRQGGNEEKNDKEKETAETEEVDFGELDSREHSTWSDNLKLQLEKDAKEAGSARMAGGQKVTRKSGQKKEGEDRNEVTKEVVRGRDLHGRRLHGHR